jgi:hypothetical protein
MKKSLLTFLTLICFGSVGHAPSGKFLGGGNKKPAATDQGTYIEQGKQIVAGYLLIQKSMLEVAIAQAEAEGDLAEARKLNALRKSVTDDPSTEDLEKIKQATQEFASRQDQLEKRAIAYSEQGRAALQQTLPRAFASVAGGAGLSVLAVKWLEEYPNQLKAAGTFGKVKLVSEVKVPLFVAKEIPSALKNVPALVKAMGYAEKQGVDVKDAKRHAAKLKL